MKSTTIRIILCTFLMLQLFSASTNATGKANLANEQTTKLTFDNQTGTYGGTLSLSATLTTTGPGQPAVPGVTIVFTFNNGASYYGTTDPSGVAAVKVSLAEINAGTYTKFITANFWGTPDRYQGTSATADLIVNPVPTEITVSNVQTVAGNTVTLTASLNAGSISLSDRQISFSVNGVSKGIANTGGYGTATLSGVSVADLPAGAYQIEAGFSPSGGNFAASTGKGTLTITGLPTTLSILPANGTQGVYGGTVTLKAHLASSGSGLSGRTISFTCNNSTYTAVTDAGGVATVTGVSIAGIEAGIYAKAVSAAFAASGLYAAASAAGDLKVTQASSSLSVANAAGDYGGTTSLYATLTSGGNAVNGQTIIFSLNGKYVGQANTEPNGTATLPGVSLSGISANTYTGAVTANFAGSRNYTGSSGSTSLTVNKASTSLDVLTSTGTYGGLTSLTATLTSGSTALSGMDVRFNFHGALYSGTTDGSGAVTINNVSLSGIDANTYTGYFTAGFDGSDYYKASSGTGNLTVSQAPAALSVDNQQGLLNGSVTLAAFLTSSAAGLPGKSVSFKINGVSKGSIATDENGKATLSNVSLAGLAAGSHTIEASFSPSGGNYAPVTGRGTLWITEIQTELSVSHATAIYGTSATLSATLSSSGIPLEGKTISFILNGASYSAQTNASGAATVEEAGIAGLDAGTHTGAITASFAASEGYKAVSAKGDLTIEQAATSLSVDGVEAAYGSMVTLTAKLTASSIGLKGKTIDFTINGVSKGNAPTDINGVATLNNVSLSGIEAGTYNNYIGASFSPESGNHSASSASANLIVKALRAGLVVTNAAGTYGKSVTLEATLTSSGSPMPDRTIIFTFNGVQHSAQTNPKGVASVPGVSISGINTGTHTGAITAEFAASEGYTPVSASGDLTVEAASTELLVSNASGIFSETASLSATLTSEGAGLSGRSVSFKLGNASVGNAQTDDHGTASLTGISLPGYDAGIYTGLITADYAGEGNFTPSSGSGNLTVTSAPVTLAAGNATGTYGATVNLTATLSLTSSGSSISGQKISFKLNDNFAGEATTVDGVATLKDVSLGNINAGIYPGKIEASYSPSGGNYEAGKDTGWLQVTPASTTLLLEKVEAPFGSTVILKATLFSGNTFISGRTISFTLNGNTKGTASTGTDGVALVEVGLAGIGAGTYNNYIGAGFSPVQDNYSGSSALADLKVYELPATLSVTNVTGTFGGSVNLEANLSASGVPLTGKTISFTVNGTSAGTSTTGPNGAASFPFSLVGIEAGSYTGKIKAAFAASDGYSAVSAAGDLTVQKAATLLTVSEATGTFGGVVDLTATLLSGEAPLAKRTISFKLNGKEVGTALTEINGAAVMKNVSLSGINAGTYQDIITADFQAEKNYISSAGLGKLTVNQAGVNILVSKATGPYNGKASLEATITGKASGSPLSGITLTFKLNNIPAGTAVTGDDGVATLSGVSIAGVAVGKYDDYIEAGYSPAGGSYAAGTGKGQLEVVPASANLAVSKITAVYSSKVILAAVLTSSGLPLSGRVVEFTLNNVSLGTGITDANGLASKPGVDLTGIGVGFHPACICAAFAGDDSYKICSNTADLEITRALTAISVLPAEVQYSDLATLFAEVTSPAAQGSLNSSGGSVEFKYQLGNGPVTRLGTVRSSSVVNGCLNFSYNFPCRLDPKTYKILASFTPSDQMNFEASSNAKPYGPLLVEQEDAEVEYTGHTYISTASPTSMTAALTYSATIKDVDDGSRGNISEARVNFIEVPSGGMFNNGIDRGTNLPVFLAAPADESIGTSSNQAFSRQLSPSEINGSGSTFHVYTKVSGNYSKLSLPAVITIGIPGSDNISGGGFIVSNYTAGKYRSKAGAKANFGFTLKYNKPGGNNQGQADIIIPGEDDNVYRIKSNAINSVSVYSIKDSPGKAAKFNAKANLTDITNPFNPVSLGGPFLLTVEMYDSGEKNENDAVAITLQDPDSGLLYSSNWSGSKTALQTLVGPEGCGNIRVLSATGLPKGMAEEIIPEEYALYQNFPNPFNPSTNIQFDLPEESRVKIVIYNILGREVATLVNDDLPAGKHQAVWNSQGGGNSFASGMYILRITAKSQTSQRSLISTKKMMLVK